MGDCSSSTSSPASTAITLAPVVIHRSTALVIPQSIAIGVENNDFVGPRRAGPRNQRRTPGVINTAFDPRLMWNGRFSAISGDPFDNSKGFLFPATGRDDSISA